MQETSALYKQLLADPKHVKEWRVQIGEAVYAKANLVSIRRTSALYGKNLIGGACSGSLELVLWGVKSEDVPTMAEIGLRVRLAPGAPVRSITIPRGRIRGDVNGNGEVDSDSTPYPEGRSDSTLVLAKLTGLISLDEIQTWCADVNADGMIDSTDALKIMRRAGGDFSAYENADYYDSWTWRDATHDWVCFVPSDIPTGAYVDLPDGFSCAAATGGVNVYAVNPPVEPLTVWVYASQPSEWLLMGTYWVDRRKYDREDDTLALQCVDGMMFAEQEFYPLGSKVTDWTDKTMREAAQLCAVKMGIALEEATQFQNAEPYILTAPPIGYSVRQVLAGIAAAHSGNIIVTAKNELRLVPLNSAPPETHNLITEGGSRITFGGVGILV